MWLHNPYLRRVPGMVSNQCVYITPACARCTKWASKTWIHNPCLGGISKAGSNKCGYIHPAIPESLKWDIVNEAT